MDNNAILLLGVVFLFAGAFFSIVAIVGVIRMPDVYGRIHSAGKVSTLGLFSLLLGVACIQTDTGWKALALALFLVLTAPVASHAIARAAYRSGVPMSNPLRDDLAEAMSIVSNDASTPLDETPLLSEVDDTEDEPAMME